MPAGKRGAWGGHDAARGGLDQWDFEDGLHRSQKPRQGYVNPEGLTHGTSEQRQRWFNQGFRTGDPKQYGTFSSSRWQWRIPTRRTRGGSFDPPRVL
jgi:predicted metalloprotease